MSMPLISLAQRLERVGGVSPEELQAVVALGNGSTRHIIARKSVVDAGQPADVATMILGGTACRYELLDDGRRQIFRYLFRGDVCHLEACLLNADPEPIAAISPLEILRVPRSDLLHLIERFPRILRAFWRLTAVEQAITRQWMMNLGQRSALVGTAHLLCELFMQLQSVGLADKNSCELSMTQCDLADSLALTPVHVNRTLMELRRRGLITFRNRRLKILDFLELSAVGDFNPEYLQLSAAPPFRWSEALDGVHFNSPGFESPARDSSITPLYRTPR